MTNSPHITELAHEIVEALCERNETLSTAESLTAGALSSAIVRIPGASDVFTGGITAYSDDIKISHLYVDPELIADRTSISQEVAIAMAQGAMRSFGTTWGIATTGVAGPDPVGSHPVGTVWVAIEGPVSECIELSLSGERETIRNAVTASAIATFARILRHRS
jgi:nicotinamide-nucleotide amidase